ncbi:hypothetical protein PABG_05971 [Paracoccidioides brasiliensis Pb03]|nr:hypothetical protein PABG_05971 [Paracoccidioides brasiliensis Pb03]
MNRDEHEYNTPTPGPRGETGQRDEINMNESNMNMMQMMMEYMKRQDRQIERLIQRLGENSDSLSNTTKDLIKDKVDEFCKDAKIKLEGKHAVILTGAKDVLNKQQTAPPTTVPLEIELWNKKNELLYTRIFQSLNATAKLVSLGENWAEGTYHDLFILGLRDWQQEFVRIKLDDFYATKQGPIQNPNLDELMDQLATRATTTTTHPNPSAANAATE